MTGVGNEEGGGRDVAVSGRRRDKIGLRPAASFLVDDTPQFPGAVALDVLHRQMTYAMKERAGMPLLTP